MIDVIYLVKDKNRCHVYEPPQGLEISGPEAARDRSSYAVNRGQGQKSMGMAPGPEAAAAGKGMLVLAGRAYDAAGLLAAIAGTGAQLLCRSWPP